MGKFESRSETLVADTEKTKQTDEIAMILNNFIDDFKVNDGLSPKIAKILTQLLLKFGVENPEPISQSDANIVPELFDAVKGGRLAKLTNTNGFPQGTEELSAISPDQFPVYLQDFIDALLKDQVLNARVEMYESMCIACDASIINRKSIIPPFRVPDLEYPEAEVPTPKYPRTAD